VHEEARAAGAVTTFILGCLAIGLAVLVIFQPPPGAEPAGTVVEVAPTWAPPVDAPVAAAEPGAGISQLVDPEWAASHLSISRANDMLLQDCLAYIDRTFGAGSELATKVTPDFAPFGKRIIRDPGGYYPALTREHVEVVAAEPARVTPAGIVTPDGDLIELDAIVYATGFHLDFLSTMEIRGRDGKLLTEEWAGNDPRAYRGGTVPGFPNLFITSAPNANPSHGAGNNFGIEVAVHYIVECLQLMALRGATTMEVTAQAFDDYVDAIDEAMARTVWCHTPNAHTYYRSGSGRVVVATPYRLVDVWHQHRAPIEEHFHLR